MKLHPNNLKFKKFHKAPASNLYLKEQKVFFPLYGGFALKALATGKLTLKQIEACRKSVRRSVKKEGRVWVRVFAYQSLTKKSLGSRMGKGKGNHSSWVAPVKSGQVICELSGAPRLKAQKALVSAGTKLPFKTKVIKLIY